MLRSLKFSLSLLLILSLMITSAFCSQNITVDQIYKLSPQVKRFIDTFNGTARIEGVNDIGALYELVVTFPHERRVIYLTKDFSYLILGAIYDRDARNLTHQRFLELNRIDLTSLPLDIALYVPSEAENASKKVVVFIDPLCPYCKSLFNYLKDIKPRKFDLYVFFYPISERGREMSVRLVCAEKGDFFKKYESLESLQGEECERGRSVVDVHYLIGQSLGIRGTPFVILGDGTNFFGFNPEIIRRYLES